MRAPKILGCEQLPHFKSPASGCFNHHDFHSVISAASTPRHSTFSSPYDP